MAQSATTAATAAATTNADIDLDAFLTLLEAKLRGPFSSLDLAKAVSSAALTETDSATHYLENVLAVLPRSEKVTQLRCMIGLLGLEPSGEADAVVQRIVEAAQEAPVYEEWVRVVAGLVQGILFQVANADEDDQQMETEQSSFKAGGEARLLLNKTCAEILDRVRKLERETAVIDEETEHLLAHSDADPLFAPYCYALLPPDLLEQVIPEVKAHEHFHINDSADILFMDAKLELEKAKEEQEHHHQQAGLVAAKSTSGAAAVMEKDPATADFPGFGNNNSSNTRNTSSKSNKAAATVRPKSSMFMPAKPPAAFGKRPLGGALKPAAGGLKPAGVAAGGLKPVVKPMLHQRKAGAAQALLAKGRRARLMKGGGGDGAGSGNGTAGTLTAALTTAPATNTTNTLLGRTAATAAAHRGGANKIKMKMIDVTEVQGLEAKKQEAVAAVAPPAKRGRKALLLSGNKRSKPDTSAADANEKVSRSKKNDTAAATANGDSSHTKQPPSVVRVAASDAAAPTATAAGALASAALLAYQSQLAAGQPPPHTPTALLVGGVGGSGGTKQQDWRQLLQQKSNRLSEEDRLRVQQFFVDHFNPTPELGTYKMKLHEERTTDANNGDPVKETYYLELDYNNFTSKQSKKVKRYKEGH